jgi:hypothetical protein
MNFIECQESIIFEAGGYGEVLILHSQKETKQIMKHLNKALSLIKKRNRLSL